MRTASFTGPLLLLLPAAGLALAAATVTVPMAEKNHSGVSGTAVVVANGDSTVVSLKLKGQPGATLSQPGHRPLGGASGEHQGPGERRALRASLPRPPVSPG